MLGLGPLEEETQARRQAMARSVERPPTDWVARQGEMEMWLRKVGWRT